MTVNQSEVSKDGLSEVSLSGEQDAKSVPRASKPPSVPPSAKSQKKAAKRLERRKRWWYCRNSLCKHSDPNEPIVSKDLLREKRGQIACPRCRGTVLVSAQPHNFPSDYDPERIRRAMGISAAPPPNAPDLAE